jgi:2,3-bisphosphoglycerate-independent phosphoglycerate mutase
LRKKVVLIITDGIGYREICEDNAFCRAKKPTYDYLLENAPYSLIETSGLSVGLPDGQMGNSEVGHMTIGAGRILYQNLVKISKSIEDNTLKENPVLKDVLNSKRVHIVGLLSDGGVHSHIDHIIALAKIAKEQNRETFLHLITDGRDVPPKSALKYLETIEKELPNVTVATIGGRYYTMDRDKRWDRVEKGYQAIVNAFAKTLKTPKEYIEDEYNQDRTDEFLLPTAFNGYDGLKNEDGVIFANFRSDRMREIVDAITNPNFTHFETKNLKLNVATMTEYSKDFTLPVLFKEELPQNVLASIISEAGLRQFHTAETEKYAHVTFFLNGGVEEPFINETRVLIPSPDVKTYDLQPEMSAPKVADTVLKAMDEEYEFIVVNFANGDMVGHTGVLEASIKAVECVDEQIGKILKKAKEKDYSIVLTSDHGNCEQMLSDDKSKAFTQHTTNKVFCFVIDDEVKKVKEGGLYNIAPTVLELMGLEKSKEMESSLI